MSKMMLDNMLWQTLGLTRTDIKKLSMDKLEANVLYAKAIIEIEEEKLAK